MNECWKDPEQLVNLADDAAYAEVKEKLATQLMEQLKITGDPRAIGGAEVFDKVPYLGKGPRHPSFNRDKE